MNRRTLITATVAALATRPGRPKAASTTMTGAAFLDRLERTDSTGYYAVESGGVTVPLRVYRRAARTVIFTFQGSINRSSTPTPIYGTNLSAAIPDATIIGISDPAWEAFPTITSGWYAGWDGTPLQSILSDLIADMVDAIGGIERVIFTGGSAGGFASLYYASTIPGSIAVVSNPQTDLDRYTATGAYRNACWPGLVGSFGQVITSNLVSVYHDTFANTVVYLQNPTDAHHMTSHLGPFLTGIKPGDISKVAMRTPFSGGFGHVAIPTSEMLPWLRAAMDADTATAHAIQETANR